MPKPKKRARKHPAPERIDRWATLNDFVDVELAELDSPSAALLWFVLFALADGRNGLIHGASKSRLAKLTGQDRHTVRRGIQLLIKAEKLIVEQDGTVPVYRLVHEICVDD